MNKEQAEKCLNDLKSMASNKGLYDVCKPLFDDIRFVLWSGSSKSYQHHYGDHGLVIHTHEVVSTCQVMKDFYPQYEINEKELFLAALFHDSGKMWDYELDGGPYPTDQCSAHRWKSAEHKRMIHHISRSAIFWNQCAQNYISQNKIDPVIYQTLVDSVTHAILAHHGQREWGSPVAPKSRVAWLLHLCDGISARLYDADTLDIVER